MKPVLIALHTQHHPPSKMAAELAKAAWIMGGFELNEKTMTILEPKFEFGEIVATAAVIRLAAAHGLTLYPYLRRHHCGDWGDLCDDDKAANDEALESGDRILSAYQIAHRKIFIITEHDCTRTTIMLASEF